MRLRSNTVPNSGLPPRYGRSPGLVIALTAGLAAMALTFRGNRKIRAFCGGIHPTAAPCKEFDDYADFYCAAALYGGCTVGATGGGWR